MNELVLSDSYDDRNCRWGKVLFNGALLLEYDSGIVLAKWKTDEYVTWKVDVHGYMYAGHYFKSLKDAWKDFTNRVAENK